MTGVWQGKCDVILCDFGGTEQVLCDVIWQSRCDVTIVWHSRCDVMWLWCERACVSYCDVTEQVCCDVLWLWCDRTCVILYDSNVTEQVWCDPGVTDQVCCDVTCLWCHRTGLILFACDVTEQHVMWPSRCDVIEVTGEVWCDCNVKEQVCLNVMITDKWRKMQCSTATAQCNSLMCEITI